MSEPLADFKVIIEQPVDWADMDSFAHVNNVVYFRYFENVRVEYFRRIGWWDYMNETGIGPDRWLNLGAVSPAGEVPRYACRWRKGHFTRGRSLHDSPRTR